MGEGFHFFARGRNRPLQSRMISLKREGNFLVNPDCRRKGKPFRPKEIR